jgi:hypothetical protein
MTGLRLILCLQTALLLASSQTAGRQFAGRWDLTLTSGDFSFPSWIEITKENRRYKARVQERGGHARPASRVNVVGQKLIVELFSPPPSSQGGQPAPEHAPLRTWELSLANGSLDGWQKRGQEVEASIRGTRAPALRRAAPRRWSPPETLFNGRDLTGWATHNNMRVRAATNSHWVARNGELVNQAQGHNIRTIRVFDDFKLHVEFNLEAGANSGIYLRGRYECQLPPPGTRRPEGSPRYPEYAIYGMIPASKLVPGSPGVWRTYDITLIGRRVTLVLDGTMILDHREIPGITGGALDSNEAEPGPILLQGDHCGGIRYRNIAISLPCGPERVTDRSSPTAKCLSLQR